MSWRDEDARVVAILGGAALGLTLLVVLFYWFVIRPDQEKIETSRILREERARASAARERAGAEASESHYGGGSGLNGA
jgi:type II secretory pathway component PulM